MKKNLRLPHVYLFALLSCAGCVSQKQISNYVAITQQQAQIEQEILKLSGALIKRTREEVELGQLSSENASKIINSLENEMMGVQQRKATYKLIEDKLVNGKNKDKKAALATIDKELNQAATQTQALTARMTYLNQAYDTENLKVFQTAAFFPSGEFRVPKEHIATVNKTFISVFDEIVAFTSSNNTISSTAIVTTVGYADEQGFNSNSKFVKDAQTQLNDENPERGKLNLLLSTYRAETLANTLRGLLPEKFPNLAEKNINSVVIDAEGKGEEYPNPTISDYKPVDERRRIVVVYWNAIPTEFLKE